MQCKTCKRELKPCFLSANCDWCDYGVPPEACFRGFVVLGRYAPPTEEYVFRDEPGAAKWREAAAREECAIKVVYSLTPYRWHLSRGTLRDVVLADHRFEIFADHKYEPLPHRAFLEKDER